MSRPVVLAIDQGTTNTKVVLLDEAGGIVGQASRPMRLSHPRPGWAEQSADRIWQSAVEAIGEALAATPDHHVLAVAITNQRETIVLWDAVTGQAVAPAISWQCRRSSDDCARLRDAGHGALVEERTGLGLDPLFSAGKLGWLLRHVSPDQDPERLRAGTVDSWLLWNLTGGAVHATDHGNAARTQLFDIRQACWDDEIAALFGVPTTILPQVRPSNSRFGSVSGGRTAIPAGVPVHAMMGDSHAALFAHGVRGPGAAKVTIGTGSSIMTVTDSAPRSSHGLSATIAWSEDDRIVYALEGNITVSGGVAAFATTMLGLPDEVALTDLAMSVPDTDGVVFVPALAGLGAPHWRDRARGTIGGLTLRTRPAHIARAALEAVVLQIADVVGATESDLCRPLGGISTDGGATKNNFLMQTLADFLDRPVTRLAHAEASAIGAAQMAGRAMGWTVPSTPMSAASDRFAPAIDAAQRGNILDRWALAIERTIATD